MKFDIDDLPLYIGYGILLPLIAVPSIWLAIEFIGFLSSDMDTLFWFVLALILTILWAFITSLYAYALTMLTPAIVIIAYPIAWLIKNLFSYKRA